MDHLDQFQEKLERLDAGDSLEQSVADLPENEASLLRLAAQLQQLSIAQPSPETITAQHRQYMQKAQKEKMMKTTPSSGMFKWLIPAALGGFMCLFLTAMTATVSLWLTNRNTIAENTPASEIAQASKPTLPNPDPSATPAEVVIHPTATPVESVPMAIASLPEYNDPKGANLRDLQGIVEIQDHNGTWIVVNAGHVVAGQRVRTGPLSSVRLELFDGSQIIVGPDSEISFEKLNAPQEGARKVFLTQWAGTSQHDPVPSTDPASEYQVQTPTSTGLATGTSFQVVVLPSLLTRYIVLEGSVTVISLNVTVVVFAGQVVTVNPDEPPSDPVFQIRGEGEVTAMGDVWTIGGQTFQVNENTIILGNPQIGDIVRVEGRLIGPDTRVADLIVFVQRGDQNQFSLTGPVSDIQPTQWIIAGQTILVNEQTQIDTGIQVGMTVQVRGVILPEGGLLASSIRLLPDDVGLPFQFTGVVQGITPHQWMISNILVEVTAHTQVEPGLQVGDLVEVSGVIIEGNRWVAASIRRVVDPVGTFDLTGVVSSINPWIIAGQAIETRENTQIIGEIQIGDLVRATGQILEDGTWVARSIERLHDDDDQFPIITFVGQVISLSPWNVGGIPLVVNEQTIIVGDVQVGSLVRVRAMLLPDGTWLALSIIPIEPPIGVGCFIFTDIVISISVTQIILGNGPVIDLDDSLDVQGDIQPNSIIIISTCHSNGVIVIVNIVVIYQLEIIIVPPVSPPGGGGGDDDDDDDD